MLAGVRHDRAVPGQFGLAAKDHLFNQRLGRQIPVHEAGTRKTVIFQAKIAFQDARLRIDCS